MTPDNVLLALTIANRLLALVASSREAGRSVSDEQLAEALNRAVDAREKWYALDDQPTTDD